MDKPLTIDAIDKKLASNLYTQDYKSKPMIQGVSIITLKNMSGEDSDFSELMRLNAQGESEQFPGFHVTQINRSTQIPGSIKAWHVHLAQDEVWYVPDEAKLLTCLWDVRKDSPTLGMTMRIPMGGSTHRMLYIPRGVAHGSANLSNETGVIMYFMNSQFNIESPDEHRIPWDTLGKEFWDPQRD
jgi:dTDP-4-dehydrorhamnose 3,5-epimerase